MALEISMTDAGLLPRTRPASAAAFRVAWGRIIIETSMGGFIAAAMRRLDATKGIPA